jgi:hypothetical protein
MTTLTLEPSEIHFDQMGIWVRIMDLPLGWMNKRRGEKAMGLIGAVKKMDVDNKDGKASVDGPYNKHLTVDIILIRGD